MPVTRARALILAAGQGTRLRPYTDDRPKCLVPLLGKPLLLRQMEALRHEGIDDIAVVAGYRSDQIEALGVRTIVNPAFETTNMVASLFSAEAFIEAAPADLIIGYGDIIYQRENLRRLLANNDEVALMIDRNWRAYWSMRAENPLDDAETLLLDPDNRIRELGRKPEGYESIQGQYTGLIKVRGDRLKAFIDFYRSLDEGGRYDGRDHANMFMTSFLQKLIDAGWPVRAVLVDGGWLEVDTVDDLRLYERLAAEGVLGSLIDLNA